MEAQSPRQTASFPSPTRFSSTMSAISYAIRKRRPARSSAPASPRRRFPFRSIPRPTAHHASPAPATPRPCLHAAISKRCFGPRTPRSAASSWRRWRAIPVCILRPSRWPMRRRRIGALPIGFPCSRWCRCSVRSIPAGRPGRRPLRSRGSSREKCRRAASKFSLTGPSHGVAAALAFTSERRACAHQHPVVAADVGEAARRFARFTGRDAIATPSGQAWSSTVGGRPRDCRTLRSACRKSRSLRFPSWAPTGSRWHRWPRSTISCSARDCDPTEQHELVAVFPEELGQGAWLFAE